MRAQGQQLRHLNGHALNSREHLHTHMVTDVQPVQRWSPFVASRSQLPTSTKDTAELKNASSAMSPIRVLHSSQEPPLQAPAQKACAVHLYAMGFTCVLGPSNYAKFVFNEANCCTARCRPHVCSKPELLTSCPTVPRQFKLCHCARSYTLWPWAVRSGLNWGFRHAPAYCGLGP